MRIRLFERRPTSNADGPRRSSIMRKLLHVLALLLGLGMLSCSRLAVMMIINASGSPVTVTLGSTSSYFNDDPDSQPDSTWSVGDSSFQRFKLAPVDSLVVASARHMRTIAYDEVPFEFLGVQGDGIEITSRDASIMSLFTDQDGDLILTLRPRRPQQNVLGSDYQGKPGAALVRAALLDTIKAVFEYRGDSTERFRIERDGDSIVFMKNDDTLAVGIGYIGHRYLDLPSSMTPDFPRRLYRTH